MSNDNEFTKGELIAIVTIIMLVIALIAFGLTLIYIDEQHDGQAERECMTHVGEMKYEGWTPDCNV